MQQRKEDSFRTFGRNTASNFFFFFVANGLNLVGYAALIRLLTENEYGLLLFAGAVLGQFTFLEGGLGTALERFIPAYNAQGKFEKINLALTATVLFFASMGVLIGCFIGLAIEFDGLRWFEVADEDKARQILWLAAIFAPFIWGFNAFTGALKGFNRYHEINLVNAVFQILLFVSQVTLAWIGVDVLYLFLVAQLLAFGQRFAFFQMLSKDFTPKLTGHSVGQIKNIFREIFGYSIWVFLAQLSSMVINQFDKIVVSGLLGVAQLPIYVGVTKIMKLLVMVSGKVKSALIPIIAAKEGKLSDADFNAIAVRGLKAMNTIVTPIVGAMVVFSTEILTIIGKVQLAEYALAFQLGTLIYVLVNARAFLHTMHIALGRKIRFIGLFGLATAACYVILAYVFIKTSGVVGAIIAAPLCHLLFYPIWMFVMLRDTHLSLWRYLKAILGGQWPTLIICLTFIVVHLLFPPVINDNFWDNIMELAIKLSIYAIGCAVLIWNFTLDIQIKSYASSKIRKLAK